MGLRSSLWGSEGSLHGHERGLGRQGCGFEGLEDGAFAYGGASVGDERPRVDLATCLIGFVRMLLPSAS